LLGPDNWLLCRSVTLSIISFQLCHNQDRLASKLECPAPDLSVYALTPTPVRTKRDIDYSAFVPTFPMTVKLGFIMDGVTALLDVDGYELTYYQDPKFSAFPGDGSKNYYKDTPLDLAVSCSSEDGSL
jgi:hypothetical protein